MRLRRIRRRIVYLLQFVPPSVSCPLAADANVPDSINTSNLCSIRPCAKPLSKDGEHRAGRARQVLREVSESEARCLTISNAEVRGQRSAACPRLPSTSPERRTSRTLASRLTCSWPPSLRSSRFEHFLSCHGIAAWPNCGKTMNEEGSLIYRERCLSRRTLPTHFVE
ncbi:hypothetical protein BD414DRAFT_330684 [Trametes punicea]|nr:hypothetical protein BD414DRAFT_330684 [Trametes punicea]